MIVPATPPRDSASDASVDAIVVHYRSAGAIHELMEGLSAQTGVKLKVIVVESGDDGSVDALPADAELTVIDRGRNLGYCEGNNMGIAAGDAPYVLIANPDTQLLAPGTLATLRDYLAEHETVAAVAPLVRIADDHRIEYASSVVDLTHASAFLDLTDLLEWPHGATEAVKLPWLAGGFWLLRRRAFEEVGPFDERFFLLCEEVDWCLRARARGWELALIRGAEVFHTRGGSFNRSSKAAYYYGRNMFLLCRRHADGRRWWLPWTALVLRPLIKPGLWRSGVPINALWGAIDALRGRYGSRPLRP